MARVPRLTREERIERLTDQVEGAEAAYFEAQDRLCIPLAELYRLGERHGGMEYMPLDDFLDDAEAKRWSAEFGNDKSAPLVRLADVRRRGKDGEDSPGER